MKSSTPYQFYHDFCVWLKFRIDDFDALIADPNNVDIVDYLRGCRVAYHDILVYFKFSRWND